MVCLDSGKSGTAFLFVVDRSVVKHPPESREYTQVNKLMTVSWSQANLTYVLAAEPEADFWKRP